MIDCDCCESREGCRRDDAGEECKSRKDIGSLDLPSTELGVTCTNGKGRKVDSVSPNTREVRVLSCDGRFRGPAGFMLFRLSVVLSRLSSMLSRRSGRDIASKSTWWGLLILTLRYESKSTGSVCFKVDPRAISRNCWSGEDGEDPVGDCGKFEGAGLTCVRDNKAGLGAKFRENRCDSLKLDDILSSSSSP